MSKIYYKLNIFKIFINYFCFLESNLLCQRSNAFQNFPLNFSLTKSECKNKTFKIFLFYYKARRSEQRLSAILFRIRKTEEEETLLKARDVSFLPEVGKKTIKKMRAFEKQNFDKNTKLKRKTYLRR